MKASRNAVATVHVHPRSEDPSEVSGLAAEVERLRDEVAILRSELERECRRSRIGEEEIRQLRDGYRQLVGDLSHELRNPMTVVVGALDLVLDGGDRFATEVRQDLLRRAREQARRLARVADTLLGTPERKGSRSPGAAALPSPWVSRGPEEAEPTPASRP